MLIKLISGSLALLAFSAAIFAGLWAGNDLSTILLRAWWALILFLILGVMIGWIAQTVIDEHMEKAANEIINELQNQQPTLTRKETGVGNAG
ncbi:MAG: hypothetical protein WC975_10520 [Phycisphaerae bacterium]